MINHNVVGKGDSQPKNPGRGARRRLKLLMATLLLFLGWAGFTLYGQMENINTTELQRTQLHVELAQAEKVNAQYQQEIVRLNDNEYIGQRARKDLQMIYPGEIPFSISSSP